MALPLKVQQENLTVPISKNTASYTMQCVALLAPSYFLVQY